MKFKIEQFPKNKHIDYSKLSIDQKSIRRSSIEVEFPEKKRCSKCSNELPIKEFYPKYFKGTKEIERYDCACKDCRMKAMGVIEIGKQRFSDKLYKKHFRRCSVCKEIKPLTEYSKSTGKDRRGYNSNCKECSYRLSREFIVKEKNELGDFHIRQYALKNYGIRIKTKKQYDKYRDEIKEKEKPKYFIDGKSFKTLVDFAEYIKTEYKLPVTMTIARITRGKTEEECKISEYEARSKGQSHGKIKVTDTITGEVFLFKSGHDDGVFKMFGKSTIYQGIKSGKPTRITSLSKYKNPCIIERI